MPEPRILHLNTEPTWRGGEQQVLYLLDGLAARGLPSEIIAQPGKPMAERAAKSGHVVHERTMHGEIDLPAALYIRRRILAGEINFVHAHTSHAHSLGAVAVRLTPAARRPKMIVARRVDFSIYRRSFFGLNGLKYRHGVDHYVTVSEAIRQVLISDGLPPEWITCVHSGIDLARIDDAPEETAKLRAELDVPDGHKLIGNVAALAGHKGQRYLIEAIPTILAQEPEVTFVIVGDGELKEELLAQADTLGVAERIRFTGFRTDVPSLLKAFDIFVMPSHMEGLGTSVLDALAARLPVVGTEAGGMPEILIEGETGLVCPIKDGPAIAKNVLRLLADPELAARLAVAGRARVEKMFSTDSMVEGTLAVYRRLLAEPA
ncbi:MAG: glycosyltransferase family 4 protein [Planctomycetes bacterium]|nr:glycosyltransferase family 4 protein [Planctomycetota bacterium]